MVEFSPHRFHDEVQSRMHGFTERQRTAFVAGCARRTVGFYEPFAPSAEVFPVLKRGLELAWRAAGGDALALESASSAKEALETLLVGEDDDDWTWASSLLNNAAIAVMRSIDIASGAEFQYVLWAVDQVVDSADYVVSGASESPDYILDLEAWPLFAYALSTLRQDLDALSGDEISAEFLTTYQSRVEQESAQIAAEAKALLGT